jgi:GGDEF domain-containing protein
MFKVAKYINNFQVRNKDVGIDMGKTLLRAITRTYLERARPEDRPALEKLVQDRIFGTTGAVVFEGKTVPVAQKLDALAARARTAIEKDSGLEAGRADALAAAVGEKQRGGFSDKLKGLLG